MATDLSVHGTHEPLRVSKLGSSVGRCSSSELKAGHGFSKGGVFDATLWIFQTLLLWKMAHVFYVLEIVMFIDFPVLRSSTRGRGYESRDE